MLENRVGDGFPNTASLLAARVFEGGRQRPKVQTQPVRTAVIPVSLKGVQLRPAHQQTERVLHLPERRVERFIPDQHGIAALLVDGEPVRFAPVAGWKEGISARAAFLTHDLSRDRPRGVDLARFARESEVVQELMNGLLRL